MGLSLLLEAQRYEERCASKLIEARVHLNSLKDESFERVEILWLYGMLKEMLSNGLFQGKALRRHRNRVDLGDAS